MTSFLKHTLVVALLLGGGCIESSTLLTVNPDGSGTITVREYMSPQITGMMSGMGGAMAGMGEAMGEAMGSEGGTPAEMPQMDLGAMLKESAEKKGASFGPGVEMVDGKERTNKLGWKGYQSKFTFADINKLRIGVGGTEMGDSGGGEESDSPDFTFKFTPGDVATLEIIPAPPDEGGDEEDADEFDALLEEGGDEDGTVTMEGGEGMDAMGEAMMAQMMGPMLKGMRMSFFVRVNGTVEDTNSSFQSPEHPNVITVMDLQMDRLLGNAEAMKVMSNQGDPKALSKIQALNIPGVKLEEEGKTVSIKFK